MENHDWILAHGWLLQIMGFYLAGVIFALLELVAPVSHKPAKRKSRWAVNFFLQVLGMLSVGFLPLSSFGTSFWAAREGFGLFNVIPVPAIVVLFLTMASRSLTAWVVHWTMHQAPFLWRIHRIHHLDPYMDVSTTVRFHPLEFFINLLAIVVTGALLGLPVWALLIYEPLEAALRYFSHVNLRLAGWLDRALRTVLSTPSVHQFHHSAIREDYEHNFGAIFSVWDRLFGTYVSPQGRDLAKMPLGLRGIAGAEPQSLRWILRSPFLSRGNREAKARRDIHGNPAVSITPLFPR